MAHLLVSAAHKSSGKTTVTIGLCAALDRLGHTVQPFKKGPDYIDPMWLGAAAGRPCHNLDFYTMERDEIRETFGCAMKGADVGVIEGNKGLYDGLDLDGTNSNAALAHLLEAPVVLVLDSQGMTRGVAPLILGYQTFDQEIRIAGVILNKVGGSRHESKLRAIIEHFTDVPVLGAVYRDDDLAIEERHLGLVPSNESTEVMERIAHIANSIADQVDLHRILELAGRAPALPCSSFPPPTIVEGPQVRIGIARDSSFGFYYPGDLEALERAGAELVFFNTMTDRQLPAVDGLFFGGGFPETHMSRLAANAELRASIRQTLEEGLPAYAECGGLMYLSRSIHWQERSAEMVGFIPADAVMHQRPQGRGYIRLRETGQGLWPLEPAGGASIRGHEFHYSSLEGLDPDLRYAYQVERGTGIDGRRDGIVLRNTQANYAHLRDVGSNHWTTRFVDFVRRIRTERH